MLAGALKVKMYPQSNEYTWVRDFVAYRTFPIRFQCSRKQALKWKMRTWLESMLVRTLRSVHPITE